MTDQEKRARLRYLQLKKKKAESVAAPVDAAAPTRAPGFVERNARTISNIARPVLSVGGAVGGAVMAGGASAPTIAGIPAGAMAGGALGYAAGDTAANALDRKLGLKAPLSGVGEAATETADSIKEGVMAEMMGLVLKPVIMGGGKALRWAGKKFINSALGPSDAAISARFNRPGDIKGAKNYEALSEDFAGSAKTIEKQVSELDKMAWKKLSISHDPNKGAIKKTDVANLLRDVRAQLQITGGGTIGKAQRKAVDEIDQYLADMPALGAKYPGKLESAMGVKSSIKQSDFLSEAQVKEIIQSIRKNVKFDDPSADITNRAIETVSESLDDILKTKNPEYAKAMKPVAERMRVLKEAERLFNLKKAPGDGYVPSDTTASKLESSMGKNKAVTKRVLRQVKALTGTDYPKATKNYSLASEFEGGRPSGSRSVNMFAGILGGLGGGTGAMFGGVPGAVGGGSLGTVAGNVLGGVVDRSGGKIAGTLIDQLARLPMDQASRLALSPAFRRVLTAAGVSLGSGK